MNLDKLAEIEALTPLLWMAPTDIILAIHNITLLYQITNPKEKEKWK